MISSQKKTEDEMGVLNFLNSEIKSNKELIASSFLNVRKEAKETALAKK